MTLPDYFAEAPSHIAKRRLRQGHSLASPSQVLGLWLIKCSCDWYTLGADKERHEHLAWMHITQPTLLVPGSSDILKPMRMEQLKDSE